MEKPTILVVDDEILNLRLMEGLLEVNYSVLTSPDGVGAIQKAIESIPDLILLDIMMPVMDGFEVCRQLKENHLTANIPVIFLTSLDTGNYQEEGNNAGGIDYLAKPYNADQLLQSVAYHLNH